MTIIYSHFECLKIQNTQKSVNIRYIGCKVAQDIGIK